MCPLFLILDALFVMMSISFDAKHLPVNKSNRFFSGIFLWGGEKKKHAKLTRCWLPIEHLSIYVYIYIYIYIYRVSKEERAKLWEGVPYVKLYQYNPKHLCPMLNGYGDKGQRKVWSFCGSTYCTWLALRNTHTHCPSLSTAGSSAFLAATAHVKCLVTLRTTMTWVRVFL